MAACADWRMDMCRWVVPAWSRLIVRMHPHNQPGLVDAGINLGICTSASPMKPRFSAACKRQPASLPLAPLPRSYLVNACSLQGNIACGFCFTFFCLDPLLELHYDKNAGVLFAVSTRQGGTASWLAELSVL